MRHISYILLLALSMSLSSCDRWVDNASTPQDDTLTPDQIRRPLMLAGVQDKKLSDAPLVAGVRTLYGEAFAGVALALGAMGDELTEGHTPNGLLYRHLSSDAIRSNSGTADGLWDKLHDFRARSEEILDVEKSLPASEDPAILATRAYARFIGHLHTAHAFQLLAETFSSTPSKAGGALPVNGEMISHTDLLARAKDHFRQAIKEARAPELKGYGGTFDADLSLRTATTLLMRLLLHEGRYDEIPSLLPDALKDRQKVVSIYNTRGKNNPLFSALSKDSRDVQVTADLEAARHNNAERLALPLAHSVTDLKKPQVYNIYVPSLSRHSELIIADENDVHLIKAELILRGVMTGDAVAEVNHVISRYDAGDIETTPLTLAHLTHLRRVYLSLRGERTRDLRRGLGGEAVTQWQARANQWIPLPERELTSDR